jgi:hypothetical protein
MRQQTKCSFIGVVAILVAFGLSSTASAESASRCSLQGPHAWIVPDAVFTASTRGSQGSFRGARLARLFAQSGVRVTSDLGTLSIQDDRDVYGGAAVDSSLTWQQFGIGESGAPYFHDLLVESGGEDGLARYTLTFDRPVRMVRVVRAGLIAGVSGITHPAWTATAVDANGDAVARTGEELIASYSPVPPQSFDLMGSAPIKAVTVTGNNYKFAAFSNVVVQLIGWCR